MFLLYYNARDKQSWEFMESMKLHSDLAFIGAFPMEYSANSVVQDNRSGAMKTDYVLVMGHKKATSPASDLCLLPGWIDYIPKIEEKSSDATNE